MFSYHPTVILRHKKENLKKCSLRGLEKVPEFHFFTYPKGTLPDVNNYLILDIEAKEELSLNDAHCGLLLIDGTWRYAEKMIGHLTSPLNKRRLPSGFITAYPRKQTLCPFPEEGLASVEALYIAYKLLGRDVEGMLDDYYWKELFLNRNKLMLSKSLTNKLDGLLFRGLGVIITS